MVLLDNGSMASRRVPAFVTACLSIHLRSLSFQILTIRYGSKVREGRIGRFLIAVRSCTRLSSRVLHPVVKARSCFWPFS